MNFTHLPRALAAAGILACAAWSGDARCSDTSQALDRISVWLGAYYPDVKFDLYGKVANQPTHLDLDAGHDTIARARFDFLMFERQGLTFDWYDFNRTHQHNLHDAFVYDGTEFQVDTTLRAKYGFSAGSLAWHWWFGGDQDVFGVGLGATYYTAEIRLAGDIVVNGQPAGTGHVGSKKSAVAPMLDLGYKHAFSDSLRVYAIASGVRKSGGPLRGHIVDARVGVEWFPWENVGFGAEYGGTRVALGRRLINDRSFDFDIDLQGPSAFVRFRF
ncbi:MAG: hypothetical protein KF903_06025 [Dokdonella sp.]|uniref:hypothetical protein n=1 Tax=Dokdonella sp. TaxID=2291710 RepID=UPI0025BFED83|nr:hypothetical protein [Dokdonella sp.]MBX3700542.1 hypothetical protein [Dokdonella sp.]MCW5577428.1 hypothetical protein [Dokdonella sp.]